MEKNCRKRWIAGALDVAMYSLRSLALALLQKQPVPVLILSAGASFEFETDFTNLKFQEGETADLNFDVIKKT